MWCVWKVNNSGNSVFPQKVKKIKKLQWLGYLTLSQKQKIENIFYYGNVIIVYSVELIAFLYEGRSPLSMRKKKILSEMELKTSKLQKADEVLIWLKLQGWDFQR